MSFKIIFVFKLGVFAHHHDEKHSLDDAKEFEQEMFALKIITNSDTGSETQELQRECCKKFTLTLKCAEKRVI